MNGNGPSKDGTQSNDVIHPIVFGNSGGRVNLETAEIPPVTLLVIRQTVRDLAPGGVCEMATGRRAVGCGEIAVGVDMEAVCGSRQPGDGGRDASEACEFVGIWASTTPDRGEVDVALG